MWYGHDRVRFYFQNFQSLLVHRMRFRTVFFFIFWPVSLLKQYDKSSSGTGSERMKNSQMGKLIFFKRVRPCDRQDGGPRHWSLDRSRAKTVSCSVKDSVCVWVFTWIVQPQRRWHCWTKCRLNNKMGAKLSMHKYISICIYISLVCPRNYHCLAVVYMHVFLCVLSETIHMDGPFWA